MPPAPPNGSLSPTVLQCQATAENTLMQTQSHESLTQEWNDSNTQYENRTVPMSSYWLMWELIYIYIYIGQPLCRPYIQFISSLYPTWKDLGISCVFHQRNRTCGHCGHKDISLDPKSAYLKSDMGANKKKKKRCAWEILLSHQGGSQSLSLSVVLKLSDLIAPCASLHGAETVKLKAPKSVPRSLFLSSLHDTVE